MPSSAVGLQKNGYADHLRNGESKIKPYSTVDKALPFVTNSPISLTYLRNPTNHSVGSLALRGGWVGVADPGGLLKMSS